MTRPARLIAFATGTRADWGLLCPIAQAVAATEGCGVEILATNMHLLPEYGDTIAEVEAAGQFKVRRVAMGADTSTPPAIVEAMAGCMTGMARELTDMRPDLLVILGDRFEMLATATAALMCGVPIAHIAGGEITEGAVDDSIRHAITKMSALHLTATEPYRRRVIAMGEAPERVINTGAIGVWNVTRAAVPAPGAFEKEIGFSLPEGRSLLVTFHPATLDPADPGERFGALLEALRRLPEVHILFTYPNNDARGRVIIDMIEAFTAAEPERSRAIPSLGRERYIRALNTVTAVAGNSSSGIVEVPSAGIPTVDIGIRQRGRLAGPSVIHCGDSADRIEAALRRALSPEFRALAARRENPYGGSDTLRKITEALTQTPLGMLRSKKFHDINPL